ncbi:MAG TPA: hypothetical protein VGL38_09460 [bacterium]
MTKDFGLIVTLNTLGYQYTDYQVDQWGRIFFRYPDDPEIIAIEEGFFRNTVSVPVQDFLNAHMKMKTLVFKIKEKEMANGNKSFGSRTATTNCTR